MYTSLGDGDQSSIDPYAGSWYTLYKVVNTLFLGVVVWLGVETILENMFAFASSSPKGPVAITAPVDAIRTSAA